MKKHFGEYRFGIKKSAKQAGMSPDEYYEAAKAAQSRALAQTSGDVGNIERVLFLWQTELAGVKGQLPHYFIETAELSEWLSNTVTKPDPELLGVFSSKNGECPTAGIIHTTGDDARGVLFAVNHAQSPGVLSVFCDSDDCKIGTAWVDLGAMAEVPDMPQFKRGYGLVLGLALYLKCFPGAVKEGAPDFAKHPNHFKGEPAFTIRTAPQILERGSAIPHWRSGHYRILRSSYFTQKRYQVVWVKGAAIGAPEGQFYTIEDVRTDSNNT